MEITFILPIALSILKNETKVPYRYAVYSPAVCHTDSPCEHLYDTPHGGDVSRCLFIPRDKLVAGGKLVKL